MLCLCGLDLDHSICVCGSLFTSNGVEGSDHQHEDSGQVEVPSQTHLNKQGSRVQVSLVKHNTSVKIQSGADSDKLIQIFMWLLLFVVLISL